MAYSGIEKYIFADVYDMFLKALANIGKVSDDELWSMVIDISYGLQIKYVNHPLAIELMSATMSQLEHIIDKKKISGLSHEEWEKLLVNAHTIEKLI